MGLKEKMFRKKFNNSSQGKQKFYKSVNHALDGISYVTEKERNFKIEIIIGIVVSILGIYLNISKEEWLILILTISHVLTFEMINTALERAVDLVTKEYQELAKISKDVSAGAVLIASLFSVIIGIIIFLPKLIETIYR